MVVEVIGKWAWLGDPGRSEGQLVGLGLIDELCFRDLLFKLSLCSCVADAQEMANMGMIIELLHTETSGETVILEFF